MEEQMDRMDVSSWLHSRGRGKYANGVCDALAAHGLPSGEWRQTLEAMPSKYFEDFIEALDEAAAADAMHSSAPAVSEIALAAQPEPARAHVDPEPEDAQETGDPAYAELLRECSRALSPAPELSRQSSDVIAELERMVSTPLSPAGAFSPSPRDATESTSGPSSSVRSARDGVTEGTMEQDPLDSGASQDALPSSSLVTVPAQAIQPAAEQSTDDLRVEDTLHMKPSTQSERPQGSHEPPSAPVFPPCAATHPSIQDPAISRPPQQAIVASCEKDACETEADPTPLLTQMRAKAAAAAASSGLGSITPAEEASAASASGSASGSAVAPSTPSAEGKSAVLSATTSPLSSGTGSFECDGGDSAEAGNQSRAETVVVDDVDLVGLLDHFRTHEVPPWLIKELEKSLLQTQSSPQAKPAELELGAAGIARGEAVATHQSGRSRNLAAASTLEEQQKIEELLAAPLLPPPDRDQLSPRTSPTPWPEEPPTHSRPNGVIYDNLRNGTVATDITRPTCSWAQQHPIAMATATKASRTDRGHPRRAFVRRLPHPRTRLGSREASLDPESWLMQAGYAIHGRWLVVDTFYEWKLWMRRLAQQRARAGGLKGLSPPPPGVRWRMRRERYNGLQGEEATPSRQLPPERRAKLAAEAAAAANEHLVRARQRRERRHQRLAVDRPNAPFHGGGGVGDGGSSSSSSSSSSSNDLGNRAPAGYLLPQQPHPTTAAFSLNPGEYTGHIFDGDIEDGTNTLSSTTQNMRAELARDVMLMNDRQHRTHLSHGGYLRPPSAKPASGEVRERAMAATASPTSAASTRSVMPGGDILARSHGQNSHNRTCTDRESGGLPTISPNDKPNDETRVATPTRLWPAAVANGSVCNGQQDVQLHEPPQSDVLSLTVAELECGLKDLHQMLKPYADLLLQEDDRKTEPGAAIYDKNGGTDTKIFAGQGDGQREAPRTMRAAIGSAETAAEAYVHSVTCMASGSVAHDVHSSHDHRQHGIHEDPRMEQRTDAPVTEERIVTVDQDALIELGPPATAAHRYGRRSDHASGNPTEQAADHPLGRAPGASHVSGRGYGYSYSPPACNHSRSRSISPPASPIYTVKQEYEVVDPPTFLDLAPRERQRSPSRTGRCDSSRGGGRAERAHVRGSGKRRRH